MQSMDVKAVFTIEQAAYPYPWTEGIFRDCLKVGYRCEVCVVDERIAGYVVWSLVAGEGHVLNLCVDPAYQGRGLGRVLLRHMVAQAERAGADVLFLEVRPSNKPALRLYDSEGFGEIDRRKNYYPADQGREDAVVMARYIVGAGPA
ncbi:ribosomal protein S18-alanine N-acetyltransferase [Alkalilimnicola ehrlichii]|nr:ribosomal protein S18-alanine N-acetyltransferase [Alkalilimnicola ehrlichii]